MNGNKRKQLRTLLKMKKCRYCHSKENLTLDHKIPKVQGGEDEYKNLQCLCYRCNSMKSELSHKRIMQLKKWFVQIEIDKQQNGLETIHTIQAEPEKSST